MDFENALRFEKPNLLIIVTIASTLYNPSFLNRDRY